MIFKPKICSDVSSAVIGPSKTSTNQQGDIKMCLRPLWVNWEITWGKGAPLTTIVHEIEIWKDKTWPRRMRSSILGGFRPDIRFEGEKSMPRGIARSASFPEVRNRKKTESGLTSSSYCSNWYEICTSWHFCPLKINFLLGIWRYPIIGRENFEGTYYILANISQSD